MVVLGYIFVPKGLNSSDEIMVYDMPSLSPTCMCGLFAAAGKLNRCKTSGDSVQVWTAGKRKDNKKLFWKVSGKKRKAMKYKNWSDGEPKNIDSKMGCVSMSAKSGNTWSISKCATKMCFICQQKASKKLKKVKKIKKRERDGEKVKIEKGA